MRAVDLSLDLEALADLLDLTPFALEVWLTWLIASLGFGLVCAVLYQVTCRWRSPVCRAIRRHRADPFARPFGDVPTVAERSPAEEGGGFSEFELRRFRSRSAGVANPAVREGSGGVTEKASRGAAATRSPAPGLRKRSARVADGAGTRLFPWSWGKRRAF